MRGELIRWRFAVEEGDCGFRDGMRWVSWVWGMIVRLSRE